MKNHDLIHLPCVLFRIFEVSERREYSVRLFGNTKWVRRAASPVAGINRQVACWCSVLSCFRRKAGIYKENAWWFFCFCSLLFEKIMAIVYKPLIGRKIFFLKIQTHRWRWLTILKGKKNLHFIFKKSFRYVK